MPPKSRGRAPPPPPPRNVPGRILGGGGYPPTAGADVQQPRKPVIVPPCQMKPLRWKRLQIGQQLQEGKTIWDDVKEFDQVPVHRLANLFSRAPAATPRTASVPRVAGSPRDSTGAESRAAESGELRIITGTFQRCGRESALAKLPPTNLAAAALRAFDGTGMVAAAPPGAILVELLRLLRDNACPTPLQLQKLESARAANPELPFGKIEQYMWEISRVPSCLERLECWLYCDTCREEFELVRASVKAFESVLACFRSASLPRLLGVILAVGNYLNGNTKAGQADGFQLDILRSGGIDAVRDNEGNGDLRRFVVGVFLGQCRKDAVRLLADLRQAFKNVRRTLEGVEGGGLKMKKKVKTCLERSCDEALTRVRQEFAEREKSLEVLNSAKNINDAGDEFANVFAEKFQSIRQEIAELQSFRDNAAAKYVHLLEWLHHPVSDSSENFFLLWDDFLVPREHFESQHVSKVKSVLKPTFCDETEEIDVYSLARLWEVEVGGLQLETVITPRGAAQPRGSRSVGAPLGRRVAQGCRDASPSRRTPSAPPVAQQPVVVAMVAESAAPQLPKEELPQLEDLQQMDAKAEAVQPTLASPVLAGTGSTVAADMSELVHQAGASGRDTAGTGASPTLRSETGLRAVESNVRGSDACTADAAASPTGTRAAVQEWRAPVVGPLATARTVNLHVINSVPRAPACGPPPQCRRRARTRAPAF